jgi:hypothetical protein
MELVSGVHPVLAWILGIAGALVVIGGAWRAVVTPGIKMLRQIGRFLDDWYGRTDSDGDHQPGIRARLDTMETKIEDVHHQTHPNGGESMRDTLVRVEREVVGITHRMDIHFLEANRRNERLDSTDVRLAVLERRAAEHDREHKEK